MLAPSDVLVLNDTRVIPARLLARKATTGGMVEILLLKQINERCWQALVGGRNVRPGMRLELSNSSICCTVTEELGGAQRVIEFERALKHGMLMNVGEMPLPPYITKALEDWERYQTVYSKVDGSAAAPTAGLHFTSELLNRLRRSGIKLATCTLHIGLDTFQPVRARASQAAQNSQRICPAGRRKRAHHQRVEGGRRAHHRGRNDISADFGDGWRFRTWPGSGGILRGNTDLFITPGYEWRAVDAIITNFHLPRSTLLMMLSAFAGREPLLRAYEMAKAAGYRFYSFGDAMYVG